MNKKILIGGATVCGAAIVTYFIKRMKASRRVPETTLEKKSHHLTDAFVRAKNHSDNIVSDI